MRQIVLDTETTGLEPADGHRIIEIGAVELFDRRPSDRTFHVYLNPGRKVDEGALEVHGISNEFLADKPRFFDVVDEFLEFVDGSELIIHNAPFDIGFLDHELKLLDGSRGLMADHVSVLDSLILAREMHPGQKNSLDALCKRYEVDNSRRNLHGALLDARILAEVYLLMTGGQTSLELEISADPEIVPQRQGGARSPIIVRHANDDEYAAHMERLNALKEKSGNCLWMEMEQG